MKGLTRGPVPSLTPLFVSLQSVHQAAAAADCHEGHPEELCGLPEAEEQDTGSSDKIKSNIYFPNKQQPVTTLLRSSVLDFLLSLCIVVSVCSKYVYAAVACL